LNVDRNTTTSTRQELERCRRKTVCKWTSLPARSSDFFGLRQGLGGAESSPGLPRLRVGGGRCPHPRCGCPARSEGDRNRGGAIEAPLGRRRAHVLGAPFRRGSGARSPVWCRMDTHRVLGAEGRTRGPTRTDSRHRRLTPPRGPTTAADEDVGFGGVQPRLQVTVTLVGRTPKFDRL
jgi:hypothetical protein